MKRFILLSFCLFASLLHSQQEMDNAVSIPKNEIKVFPNPATNVINILGLQNTSKATIVISDSYGNSLLNYHWEIKNNALNIPIAHLEPGFYVITIHSPGQKIQKKFLKQ